MLPHSLLQNLARIEQEKTEKYAELLESARGKHLFLFEFFVYMCVNLTGGRDCLKVKDLAERRLYNFHFFEHSLWYTYIR